MLPSPRVSQISPRVSQIIGLGYQRTESQLIDRKKKYQEQTFLLGFYEQFHEGHDKLTQMSEFLTKEQLFEDHYLSQLL